MMMARTVGCALDTKEFEGKKIRAFGCDFTGRMVFIVHSMLGSVQRVSFSYIGNSAQSKFRSNIFVFRE